MRFFREALLGGVPKGSPAPTYLEHLVKLRLGLLEVPQNGEDSEHSREVVSDDGLAGGHHNVLAFKHEPVQSVLREGGRGRAQGRCSQLVPTAGEGTWKGVWGECTSNQDIPPSSEAPGLGWRQWLELRAMNLAWTQASAGIALTWGIWSGQGGARPVSKSRRSFSDGAQG